MPKITITFADGKKRQFKKGVTAADVAAAAREKNVLAAGINDALADLSTKITKNSKIEFVKFDSHRGREVFWHSAAHVLANAVVNLFPKAKLTIGPNWEGGFYYDIDSKPFTPSDLKKLEGEMQKIVDKDEKFEKRVVTKKEALKLFKGNPYKKELIKEVDGKLSIYKQGRFFDLCKGPHVPSTGCIKAFKLTKIAGAYWRGNVKNKQLQRIYGTAFPSKKELEEHLRLIEEARRRDHRKLGKELDLFSIHEEAPGFPFFHNKGMIIRKELISFWREQHRKAGYQEIQTPIILSKALWQKSGHWENYRENMYTLKIDEQDYAIKPMNCPGGMLVYKERTHSYRELPLRIAELGLVHRHELSGVLAGLFRVRCFTQDDAHIFMTPEQITQEVIGVIELVDYFYSKVFKFPYHVELSTRPAKSIGTDEQWEQAENSLKKALEAKGMSYKLNPGDGAFYGPKIDFHIKDCLGRMWQCATIQLDMALPERFNLTYEGKDGRKHRPVMIHRVIYGSLERFIAILLEHYAGKLPLWLSPVQVKLLTVADRFRGHAERVYRKYCEAEVRAELDDRAESIGYKVREAQLQKVPYILVVGEKESKTNTVAVRASNKVVGAVNVDEFLKKLLKEISEKA
jgi:threonyl-tRNA synthetase